MKGIIKKDQKDNLKHKGYLILEVLEMINLVKHFIMDMLTFKQKIK